MGFININEKTISAKLVYYGVGMGGKTTSLQAVHSIMCPRDEVQLFSVDTDQDSTLLFDFLPINLGQVEGFKIRIQGFTVPGQPKYKTMRRFVLQGADAVVLVIDSQRSRLEENLQSLDSMLENLRANNLSPDSIPILLQYNKRDLGDVLSEAELDQHFKFRDDIVSFPSVATDGQGVFETFTHAAGLLIDSKMRLYGLGRGEIEPQTVVESATRKLWDIHDEMRGPGERSEGPVVSVRVSDPAYQEHLDAIENGNQEFSDDDFELKLDGVDPPSEATDEAPVTEHDSVSSALESLEAAVQLIDNGDEPTVDGDTELMLDQAVQSSVEIVQKFAEVDELRRMLERKNEELVEIGQNTVHDLSHPVGAIKLILRTMSQGRFGALCEKVQEGVDTALYSVEQMEGLLDDLMDSSRLDFDGVNMDFQDVDMNTLIGEIVRGMRFEIEAREVGIRVETMPKILADSWALTKAFTNLLTNAIKYSHPERRILINVSCVEQEDRHVFMVSDNGRGISEADQQQLFKRFGRGSNTSGIRGTGLGLHIVKEAIRGHGGDVWADSVEGQGTRFCLAIPKQPEMPPHSTVSDVAEAIDR